MKKRELTEIWISGARRIIGGALGGGNAGLHTRSEWWRRGRLAAGKLIHEVVDVVGTQPGNANRNIRHPRMIERGKSDQLAWIREGSRRG
jgi:hypothetical protein